MSAVPTFISANYMYCVAAVLLVLVYVLLKLNAHSLNAWSNVSCAAVVTWFKDKAQSGGRSPAVQ